MLGGLRRSLAGHRPGYSTVYASRATTMTEPSPQLRRLVSALVVAQGLVLVGVGLLVTSVNLPRAPQRIDQDVVLTLGLGVAALGLLSLRLPVQVKRDFTVTYRLDGDGWRRLPAPLAGRAQGAV